MAKYKIPITHSITKGWRKKDTCKALISFEMTKRDSMNSDYSEAMNAYYQITESLTERHSLAME